MSHTLDARCRSCGHTWKIADLPLPVDEVGRLCQGLACPTCNGRDLGVFTPRKEAQ